MKFVPVENVPAPRQGWCPQHNLQHLIDEFANASVNTAKVEFTEKDYKSPKNCCNSLRKAIKKSGYKIKVLQKRNDVFLSKI